MNLLAYFRGDTQKLDMVMYRLGKAKARTGVMVKDRNAVTFIARDRGAKRYTVVDIPGILKC